MARLPKTKAIERLQKALNELSELKKSDSDSQAIWKWHRDTKAAIRNTFGETSSRFLEFPTLTPVFGQKSTNEIVPLESDVSFAGTMLEEMIEEIREYWENDDQRKASSFNMDKKSMDTNEIFIIHGRDNETKEAIARFLERLDLKPIILHEQSNQGRTIIEKFEQHAQVGFAVALLTPDDVGALQEDARNLKPRARQNVIFEFGYFIGRLGRNRVCALTKGDVEIQSDYDGVVYIPLDDVGGWKMKLVKELKGAGIDVDANRAL